MHEALHDHSHFAAMAEGRISAGAFDRVMARMGGFFAALDPVMDRACSRSGADAGAYVYRPRAGYFPDREGIAVLPGIEGTAGLAGAAYVVDGAMLGGQVLRHAIAGRLAHPYWDWCARDGAGIWRETQALIARADTGPAPADTAVRTAKAVFEAFAAHMDMSRTEAAA